MNDRDYEFFHGAIQQVERRAWRHGVLFLLVNTVLTIGVVWSFVR